MGFIKYLWVKLYRSNKGLVQAMIIAILLFGLLVLSHDYTPPVWLTYTFAIITGIILISLAIVAVIMTIQMIADLILYLIDHYKEYKRER